MTEATNEQNLSSWISIHDSLNQMEASFPYQPVEMTFDLPLQNIPPAGHLNIFSSSTQSSVFTISALSLPSVDQSFLQGATFKKNFEFYVVSRLFYSPHLFHNKQKFSYEKTIFKNLPALAFQFTYQEHHIPRILKGVSVVKDHIFYSIFYMTSEANFKEDDLQQFIESFKLLPTKKD